MTKTTRRWVDYEKRGIEFVHVSKRGDSWPIAFSCCPRGPRVLWWHSFWLRLVAPSQAAYLWQLKLHRTVAGVMTGLLKRYSFPLACSGLLSEFYQARRDLLDSHRKLYVSETSPVAACLHSKSRRQVPTNRGVRSFFGESVVSQAAGVSVSSDSLRTFIFDADLNRTLLAK